MSKKIDTKFGIFKSAFEKIDPIILPNILLTDNIPDSKLITKCTNVLTEVHSKLSETGIIQCAINFDRFNDWAILKQLLLYLWYEIVPKQNVQLLQYFYTYITIYIDDLSDLDRLELLISQVSSNKCRYILNTLLCIQIHKYVGKSKMSDTVFKYLYKQFTLGNINAFNNDHYRFNICNNGIIEYINNNGCICHLLSINNLIISLDLRALECLLYAVSKKPNLCNSRVGMDIYIYYEKIIKSYNTPKCIEYKTLIYRYLKQYAGTPYRFHLFPYDISGASGMYFIQEVGAYIKMAKLHIIKYLKKPMKINNLIDIVVSYYD